MKGDSAPTADPPLDHTVGQTASCTEHWITKHFACIGTICALISAGVEAWSYALVTGTQHLPSRHVQHRDGRASLTAWPHDLGDGNRQIALAVAVLLTGLGPAYSIITRRKPQVLATTCMIQGFAAFWMSFDHYQINGISDWACSRGPEEQAVFGSDVNYSAICSTQEFSNCLLFATMVMDVIVIIARWLDIWVSRRSTESTHDYGRWDSK